jgi:hypothetical protein
MEGALLAMACRSWIRSRGYGTQMVRFAAWLSFFIGRFREQAFCTHSGAQL